MVKDSVKQRRSLKKWALDIFGKMRNSAFSI